MKIGTKKKILAISRKTVFPVLIVLPTLVFGAAAVGITIRASDKAEGDTEAARTQYAWLSKRAESLAAQGRTLEALDALDDPTASRFITVDRAGVEAEKKRLGPEFYKARGAFMIDLLLAPDLGDGHLVPLNEKAGKPMDLIPEAKDRLYACRSAAPPDEPRPLRADAVLSCLNGADDAPTPEGLWPAILLVMLSAVGALALTAYIAMRKNTWELEIAADDIKQTARKAREEEERRLREEAREKEAAAKTFDVFRDGVRIAPVKPLRFRKKGAQP